MCRHSNTDGWILSEILLKWDIVYDDVDNYRDGWIEVSDGWILSNLWAKSLFRPMFCGLCCGQAVAKRKSKDADGREVREPRALECYSCISKQTIFY